MIFQPAEEGVRGAKAIVEKGHLDDVKYFFASHITDNSKYPDCDLFPGSGGALATCIMNLYLIPRHSEGATRINVGVANSGTGRNVIADYAKFLIETRGSNTEINTFVKDYVVNIIEGASKMHNLTYKINLVGEANSLESDEQLMELVKEVTKEMDLKPTPVNRMPLGGSEDVSYMMTRVQENGGLATFIRLLTKLEAQGHNVSYDFGEQILCKGVSVFVGAAYKIMKEV